MSKTWEPQIRDLVEVQHYDPSGWGRKRLPYRFCVAIVRSKHRDGGWFVLIRGDQPMRATLEPGNLQILGPSVRSFEAEIEFSDQPRTPH